MTTWNASRAGTWKKSTVTVPFTSSVTIMFTRYCWASSRSVVWTLASRRLSVIGSVGRRLAHSPWASATAGAASAASATAIAAGTRWMRILMA